MARGQKGAVVPTIEEQNTKLRELLKAASQDKGDERHIRPAVDLILQGADPKILLEMYRNAEIAKNFAITLIQECVFAISSSDEKESNRRHLRDIGFCNYSVEDTGEGLLLGLGYESELPAIFQYKGHSGNRHISQNMYLISYEDIEFLFGLVHAKALVKHDPSIDDKKRKEIYGKIDELISNCGDKNKTKEVLRSCKELREILSVHEEQDMFKTVIEMINRMISLIENAMRAMLGKHTQAIEQESQSKADGPVSKGL